jgi:hypothetical protein
MANERPLRLYISTAPLLVTAPVPPSMELYDAELCFTGRILFLGLHIRNGLVEITNISLVPHGQRIRTG